MVDVYRIFYPKGKRGGVRTLDNPDHVLRALECSRALLDSGGADEFLKPESIGVYILWGREGESADQLTVYVGEGVARERLILHDKDKLRSKDFWQYFVLFATIGDPLEKSLAHWLEASLVETARTLHRAKVDNRYDPKKPSLSSADEARGRDMLEEILFMLDLLGLDAFRDSSSAELVSDWYILRGRGAEAKGRATADGRFLVKAGALAAGSTTPQAREDVVAARKELMDREVLKKHGESYVLATDYEFSSPSAAAKVLLGHSANGLIEWKGEDGRTMKELQQ